MSGEEPRRTDQIVIDRVEWAVREASIATAKTLTIPASEDSIRSIFAGAKRALDGETAAAYDHRSTVPVVIACWSNITDRPCRG